MSLLSYSLTCVEDCKLLLLKIALDQAYIAWRCTRHYPVSVGWNDADHRSKIIQLCKEESKLKVIVVTIALGMGMDCPNFGRLFRGGKPDNLCSYIQETGRTGSDGETSMVTLLQCRTYHSVDEDIKEYVANKTQCRRDVLFKDMDSYCHKDLGSKCYYVTFVLNNAFVALMIISLNTLFCLINKTIVHCFNC